MVFSATVLRRAVTASAVTVAIALSPVLTAIASAESLVGAGATFPDLLYKRYIAEFQKKNPGTKVTYQALGSGAGIRQVIGGTVDFGGSDAAMTDAQMKEGEAGKRGVILVPTAGGSVVPIYNLPGVPKLRLGRQVLPDIFAGRITKWNDAKIAADNPGVALPDKPIKTVVRADSSGTTFIFTNHLAAVSTYFKGRVGVGTAPKWTTDPLKGRGNAGVAASVGQTAGSIGYVEQSYAEANKMTVAEVQAKNGQWYAPSLEATNAAIGSLRIPDSTFRVFDGDPANGYPITGLTWIMVYRDYDDNKAKAVREWVRWILTEGQSINKDLNFARISEADAQRVLNYVDANVK
jgi:phosphate transport system substrate-binding protein